MVDRNRVDIFTDGACKGNPGIGGWGALLRYDGYEKEIYGGEIFTTNNRMELLAAVRALETLKRSCRVNLHTDSQYLKKGISEWISDWKIRNWQTSAKKPVKNDDLWKMLDRLVQLHEIEWIAGMLLRFVSSHVNGRSGSKEMLLLFSLVCYLYLVV